MTTITQTFENYFKARRLERNTQKAYITAMRHAVKVLGDVDVESLSESSGTLLVESLRSLKGSSANQVITILRLVSVVHKNHLNVKGARVKSSPRNFLSIEERDEVLDKVRDLRHLAILSIAVFTGVRKAELFALKREDIDFQGKTLSVRRTMESTSKIKDYGKTDCSMRTIPLCDRAVKTLTEYLGTVTDEFIFWPTSSEFVDPTANILKKYTDKRVCWHSLRHTFASALIARNVSLVKVAWLLGHSKVSPTLFRYARIHQTAQLHEEVNLL